MRYAAWILALLAALPVRASDIAPREDAAPPARIVTLEDAYDLAAATDQSIRIAYERIRIANLLPWSALTALGPQLIGSAEYDANQSHARGLYNVADTSNIALTYTQPLLNFGVFPAYHYGKQAAAAAHLQRQFTIRQVLFSVTSAYYQVLSDEGTVAVDQKTVDLAGQQLDVAQKRLQVGEVTPTDALNAKVVLESAKVALIQAKNTLLLDRDTLGNLLNLGGDSGFQVAIPPDYPTTIPPFDKLLAIAYRNREDIRVGDLTIGEDYSKRGEVVAQYAPSVVGVASDTYVNDRGFYGPQSQVWDANVTVTMPFLTGGQREIDLRTAGEQVDIDRLNRDTTVKTVEANVRQAWLQAHSLQESLESLRIQVAAARESYEDEVHEYQAGTAASVDVLTALVNLNTSENSLDIQVYLYQVALRGLEQAAGVFQEQRVLRDIVK
jgi:outer membrane protein